MRDNHSFLDSLRIASPCPADWEKMRGDDRVRFCELCNLNVYNIAELTRSEAASLVANAEGRVCARLYRRADGTVITRDCPVGLRALRRRVATIAGAVFTTLMSLSAIVVGQDPSSQDKSSDKRVTISRTKSDSGSETGVISGTIRDRYGAIVVRAMISIVDQVTRKFINTESNSDGQFRISGMLPTSYEIVVGSTGFNQHTIKELKLAVRETIDLEVILEKNTPHAETMGFILVPELIETSGKPIINEQFLRRRP